MFKSWTKCFFSIQIFRCLLNFQRMKTCGVTIQVKKVQQKNSTMWPLAILVGLWLNAVETWMNPTWVFGRVSNGGVKVFYLQASTSCPRKCKLLGIRIVTETRGFKMLDRPKDLYTFFYQTINDSLVVEKFFWISWLGHSSALAQTFLGNPFWVFCEMKCDWCMDRQTWRFNYYFHLSITWGFVLF